MDVWPWTVQPRWYGKNAKATGPTVIESSDAFSSYQGSLTAANLRQPVNEKGSLEWSFLAKNDVGRRLVVTRDAALAYPPSSLKSQSDVKLSIRKRTNKTLKFIADVHPNAWIPLPILQEHLAEDLVDKNKLRSFDPFAGNILDTLDLRHPTSDLNLMVVPGYENGSGLQFSELQWDQENGVTVIPRSHPSHVFKTPIVQIVAGPTYDSSYQESNALLAVRHLGGASIIHVQPAANLETDWLQVTELVNVTREDFGGSQIVDVIFPPSSNSNTTSNLYVNTEGEIYQCTLREGGKYMQRLSSSKETVDSFYRLAQGSQRNSTIIASHSSLDLLDMRSQGAALNLLSVSGRPELFTSVERPQIDGLIRAASTRHVFWIDDRYPGRPLLSVQHGRSFDRTLQMRSLDFPDSSITILLSRRTGIITAYDVSRSKGSFTYLEAPPYTTPPLPLPGDCQTGHAFFRHPQDPNHLNASLMLLSSQGSGYKVDLQLKNHDQYQVTRPDGPGYIWTEHMRIISKGMQTVPLRRGPFQPTKSQKEDFEYIYHRIFMRIDIDKSVAVYDLLEAMPTLMQTMEPPIEYVFTIPQIAHLFESDNSAKTRSDSLAATLFNSTRGYRALIQDRIPLQQLIKQATWHRNILATIRLFIPDIQETAEQTSNYLTRYDLSTETRRPPQSYIREKEAREQLTVDLMLSSDVFSHRPPQPPPTLDASVDMMTQATADMSIRDQPPPIHYGFLDPVPKAPKKVRGKKAIEEHKRRLELKDLSVRLLLSEWEIGADPAKYVFYDPYATFVESPPVQHTKRAPQDTAVRPVTMTQPPAIAKVAVVETCPSRQTNMFGSQPRVATPPPHVVHGTQIPVKTPAVSQEIPPWPSTQVLPGKHGGRPAIKKSAKKRVAGF
ncbi:hypothetical protein ABKN59_008912 [Abortiporus biennis]